MVMKGRSDTEGFLTRLTFVGFLSCVSPQVLEERRALAEGFVAVIVLIWLFSCMSPQVLREGGALAEGFATFFASVSKVSLQSESSDV
jgi:hypothetical protein